MAAADRITAAITRATAQRLPLLASPSSGGTRMQEGTVAFLQMVKIAAAVELHKRAHLPYLVYLRHPTTGGVFASWGSLGHVTLAEPNALVGFLGPRVYEQLYGAPFPPGVQTAENLAAHGVIDGVIPLKWLRRTCARALKVLLDDPAPRLHRRRTNRFPISRRGIRCAPPGARTARGWVSCCGTVPPNGSCWRHRQCRTRRHHAVGVGALRRRPAVVLGQLRGPDRLTDPVALRDARRGMALAAGLRLPLVLVIDTPGPALSVEAEEGGLAGQIAACLAELVTLEVPTVSVLLGQGSGGPALAMVPADRVLAATHGWLAPLPPEGASAIVFRDTAHAAKLSAAQGIRSVDLRADGIVDVIVGEHPDAAAEPIDFAKRMSRAIAVELHALAGCPPNSGWRPA